MKKEMILIAIIGLVLLAVLISAEENVTDTNSTIVDDTNVTSGNETEVIKNKSLNWSIRCQATNHRVEGRIKMFEEQRDPHLNKFQNLVRILEGIINKSDAKGYNVTVLQADLTTLQGKIDKFREDYALFIQKLQNTRNYTCGHSEGRYQAALNESKNQLKIVRVDAEAIKEYFDSVVKKDFESLRQERKEVAEKRRIERDEMRNKSREDGREGMRNGTGLNGSRDDGRGEFKNGTGQNRSRDEIRNRTGGEIKSPNTALSGEEPRGEE